MSSGLAILRRFLRDHLSFERGFPSLLSENIFGESSELQALLFYDCFGEVILGTMFRDHLNPKSDYFTIISEGLFEIIFKRLSELQPWVLQVYFRAIILFPSIGILGLLLRKTISEVWFQGLS